MPDWEMSHRQCEIAAESHAASLLARAGYDVMVQYGANQPDYDLIAVKGQHLLPISVKGSQDGGWMLAVKYKTKERGYHEAVDAWLARQRSDLVMFFVQFYKVALHEAPRAYIARCDEVAAVLKAHHAGAGHLALQEDSRRTAPKSKFDDKIPADWAFTPQRMDRLAADFANVRL